MPFLVFFLSFFAIQAHAGEGFQSGNYVDSLGNKYLVSGAAPTSSGRTQWSVTSTTLASTTNTLISAIWETGAAIGNTYLAGNSNVTSNASLYVAGVSYGVFGEGPWTSNGNVISASQTGSSLAISTVNSNGSLGTARILSFQSAAGSTTASSTTFQPGVYKDANGIQYLVSGGAPSLSGRTQWSVTSTSPASATNTLVSAIWETGDAAGNTYLAGNTNASLNASAYLSGRAYGVFSEGTFTSVGNVISAAQVGTTLFISYVTPSGPAQATRALTYVSSGGVTCGTSSTFVAGAYLDGAGNQYQVTQSAASPPKWSVAVTLAITSGYVLNADWYTGPAQTNPLLTGTVTSSVGFNSGRSYGTTTAGTWGGGGVVSISQVGSTLVLSHLTTTGLFQQAKVLTAMNPGQSIDPILFLPNSITVGSSFTTIAKASSCLSVSFTTATPTVCGISGNAVTGLTPGTCTVSATQAGNAAIPAAPQVLQSLAVVQFSATTSTTTSTTSTTTTTSSTTNTTQSNNGAIKAVVGWNLVGNGTTSTMTVASVFGDSSLVATVWKWVTSGSTPSITYPVWAFYAPSLADGGQAYAAGKGFDYLMSINAGEGFWVNAKSAFSTSLPAGTLIQSTQFVPGQGTNALPPGWSLVATGDHPTPAIFDAALATSFSTPPAPGLVYTNLTTIWAWEATAQGWYFWAPSLVNSASLPSYLTTKGYLDFANIPNSPLGTLSPSNGFWVNRP